MYWEGASVRSYTPERLAAINAATVTYNGKDIDRYKATQMQRAQERQIRADKRAFLVAKESGQKDAEKAAAAKLAASRAKMKDFLSQTGLQQYPVSYTHLGPAQQDRVPEALLWRGRRDRYTGSAGHPAGSWGQ